MRGRESRLSRPQNRFPATVVSTANRKLGSLDVNPVKIVAAEAGVAFRTLSLPRLVARLDTVHAEHVKALGQYRVFVVHVAARAPQLGLKANPGPVIDEKPRSDATEIQGIAFGTTLIAV